MKNFQIFIFFIFKYLACKYSILAYFLSDNIVLALLANLADPRKKTFAGFDAYMVANEVVKCKKISLALISALNAFEIIDTMDEGSLSNGSRTSRKLENTDEVPATARKKRKV